MLLEKLEDLLSDFFGRDSDFMLFTVSFGLMVDAATETTHVEMI